MKTTENNMEDKEGVIKYRLDHRFEPLPASIDIRCINAWRTVLYRLGLIGQHPAKYHGLGYGNISERLTLPDSQVFLITGTQTGHLPSLNPTHFAMVESASAKQNSIRSSGPSQPSSEALTHASVYNLLPEAQTVIHVHCPELWRNTLALQLPHTAAGIAYGTLEMAEAVEQLLQSGQLDKQAIFSMLGHQDGIVVFAESLSAAAQILLARLADALTIEQTGYAG